MMEMETTKPEPVYGNINLSPLPKGKHTFSNFPDALMICELVFGGLVWILIASSDQLPWNAKLQGWIMFVSLSCFLTTLIFLAVFCTGGHKGSPSWITADAFYHWIAAALYLSASVSQCFFLQFFKMWLKTYNINIAAVVFGGLVWILIASSGVLSSLPAIHGWVMFVSLSCFIATFCLMIMYCIGRHGGLSSWITADVCYQCVPALLYLSAAVLQSFFLVGFLMPTSVYHINIAAVIFAYLTTLLYVIHAAFSLLRWKRSA